MNVIHNNSNKSCRIIEINSKMRLRLPKRYLCLDPEYPNNYDYVFKTKPQTNKNKNSSLILPNCRTFLLSLISDYETLQSMTLGANLPLESILFSLFYDSRSNSNRRIKIS
ncbi:unnamed protein product [Spodoptera littoralis]|uniref:Uncharacterized protein n=1 Tax=Spodoptera littoralis TaxID=7109 RepID=A0A9P0HXU8_SPOLI|nr:unnamed protein product [Spodoptera littoralis]CAH1635969.1 unnamed protein product [Spodoptera littoralis]